MARSAARQVTPTGYPTTRRAKTTGNLFDFLQRLKTRLLDRRTLITLIAAVLTINILGNLMSVATSMDSLKDIDSFLHSGLAFGQGLNPYGFHPELSLHPISQQALNLNPPISLYLFEPLSRMDPDAARVLFIFGSSIMFAVAVGALLYEYPDKRSVLVVLAVVAMAGVWHMLFYLQLYAPLILAMVGAWLLMKRGNLLLAGVLLGLIVAIKPNYALLPLVLFAACHLRISITAGVTAGLVSLVPLVLEGPGVYRQWLELSLSFEGVEWASNASLMSVGSHFGSAWAGRLVAVLLVAGVLAFQWRVRPNVMDSTAIGLLVVLLFGPVSWAGYTLLLLPFLFSRPWNTPMWAAVLLLTVPFAPHRASEAVGSGFLSSLGIHLPSVNLSLPVDISGPWQTVVVPVYSGTYAWAVLLILGMLVITLIGSSRLWPPNVLRRTGNLARLPSSPRPMSPRPLYPHPAAMRSSSGAPRSMGTSPFASTRSARPRYDYVSVSAGVGSSLEQEEYRRLVAALPLHDVFQWRTF